MRLIPRRARRNRRPRRSNPFCDAVEYRSRRRRQSRSWALRTRRWSEIGPSDHIAPLRMTEETALALESAVATGAGSHQESGKWLTTMRHHETFVELRVGEPPWLDVDRESEDSHFKGLFMETRGELRNRRGRPTLHHGAPQFASKRGRTRRGAQKSEIRIRLSAFSGLYRIAQLSLSYTACHWARRRSVSTNVRWGVTAPESVSYRGGYAASTANLTVPSMLFVLVSAPPALMATFTASSIGSLNGTSIRSNPFS